jgi:hypothetical protein
MHHSAKTVDPPLEENAYIFYNVQSFIKETGRFTHVELEYCLPKYNELNLHNMLIIIGNKLCVHLCKC